MSSREFFSFSTYYILGVGGVSMSAIAKCLLLHGKTVYGWDGAPKPELKNLVALGVATDEEQEIGLLEKADCVIYSDAVDQGHFRMRIAIEKGKRLYSRGQAWAEISTLCQLKVAFSGCHGKTTATAMFIHILSASRLGFIAHTGGMDQTFGNFVDCGRDVFACEACEYKRNLRYFHQFTVGVWLNFGLDHMECYQGEEDLKNEFISFTRSCHYSLYNGEDENIPTLANGFTFGVGGGLPSLQGTCTSTSNAIRLNFGKKTSISAR